MPVLDIIMDGDNCWPELKEKGFITGNWVGIARLRRGMVSGAASVTVRIELPDGQTVLAETSLALIENAARAFRVAEENGL